MRSDRHLDDEAELDALEALDRVLEELRREFRANPEFAYRVVKALGASVSFESQHAAKLLNLRELAATHSEEDFRAALDGLTPAELRATARASNLATTVDMKGRATDAIITMLHERATAKSAERQFKAKKPG